MITRFVYETRCIMKAELQQISIISILFIFLPDECFSRNAATVTKRRFTHHSWNPIAVESATVKIIECNRTEDCRRDFSPEDVCVRQICLPRASHGDVCVNDDQCQVSNPPNNLLVCSFLTSRCTCKALYKWKADDGVRDCIPEDVCKEDNDCLHPNERYCDSSGYCVPRTLMTPVRITILSVASIFLLIVISSGVVCCRRQREQYLRRRESRRCLIGNIEAE